MKRNVVLIIVVSMIFCLTVSCDQLASGGSVEPPEAVTSADETSDACKSESESNTGNTSSNSIADEALTFLGEPVAISTIRQEPIAVNADNFTHYFEETGSTFSSDTLSSPNEEHSVRWKVIKQNMSNYKAEIYLDDNDTKIYLMDISPIVPEDIFLYIQWLSDSIILFDQAHEFYDIDKGNFIRLFRPTVTKQYDINLYRHATVEVLDINPLANKVVCTFSTEDSVVLGVFDLITSKWTIVHQALPCDYETYNATWVDDNNIVFTTNQIIIDNMLEPKDKEKFVQQLYDGGIVNDTSLAEKHIYNYNLITNKKELMGQVEGMLPVLAQRGKIVFVTDKEIFVFDGSLKKLTSRVVCDASPELTGSAYLVSDSDESVCIFDFAQNIYLVLDKNAFQPYYLSHGDLLVRWGGIWYRYKNK